MVDKGFSLQCYLEILPLVITLLSSNIPVKLYNFISQKRKPYASFFTGDFNGHSQFWWPDGDTTSKGREIENLINSLNLSQLISEPINFQPNKNPSCIDLVITDQPNLILDCGTRAALDSFRHHRVTYCKVNFNIPPLPPFERKIRHYDRANIPLHKRSMFKFPRLQHLDINQDPNWQVKTSTKFFLNFMANFIPNEMKRIIPRDPPWITERLKTMLNRKNRFFKNYKRHGYKLEDKVRLDNFRKECQEAVENAKLTCLANMGKKLNNPNTGQKSYWKIINKVINKCKAPKIPPLLVNIIFVLNYREKAKLLTDCFHEQCKPVINDSVLPNFSYLTNEKIEQIPIDNENIVSLIRKLTPNTANGSEGICGQILLLCDDSVVLPLRIIFGNILSSATYPDMETC